MQDARHLARRWFEEVWNRQREATLDELCSDDFQATVTGLAQPAGKEDFRRHFRSLTRALPDLQVEALEVHGENGTAVVRFRMTGTHTGPGLGVPPSGRSVRFEGISWMVWRDGKLVRGEDRWNRGEVLAQLTRVGVPDLRRRHDLTRREAQVALLMAERLRYKEIARELGIRPNTVRRHSTMVLRKLGVHRREDVASQIGTGRPSAWLAPHDSGLPT